MGINLGTAYGQIDIGTEGAEKSVQSLAASMRSAGTAMSLGVTAPLAGIAAIAINSAADFEQSLNVMAQVTDATAGQMASMQEQALSLGAETSFSAGEAATAMLELAKAGLSVQEVGESIGGVMDLAAAGNLELARAAEITANAVNAFNLPASDSAKIANLLAAAANASSVEVIDLAQGMNMASAVFASSGQSVGDLNTALALLGNNGIKGSDAGTSLKTMMMRLTAPTKDAAQALDQLGINVYDMAGNTRALPAIMADLQQAMMGTNAVSVFSSNLTGEQADRMDYLGDAIQKTKTKLADYQAGIAGVSQSENDKIVAVDRLNRTLAAQQAEYAKLAAIGGTTSTVMKTLTEAERNQALTAVFGADAVRAVNVLLAEGTDGWDAMAGALGNESAAAEVADARMRGMSGAIEYLKGSIDSFLIGQALPFLDNMSGIVRVVADAVTALGNLPEPVKSAALAFAAVLAAAGPAMLALAGIGAVVGFILSPIGLVVGALALLAAALAADFMGIRTVAVEVGNLFAAFTQSDAVGAAWERISTAVTAAGTAIADLFSGNTDLGGFAAKISAAISEIPAAISDLFGSTDFATLRDGIVAALGLTNIDFSGVVASVQTFGANFAAAVTAFDYGGAFDGLKTAVVGAVTSIDWGGALTTAGAFLDGLKNGVVAAITSIDWGGKVSEAGDFLAGLRNNVVNRITTINWGGLLTAAGDFLVGLKSGVTAAIMAIDWGAAFAAQATLLAGLTSGVVAALMAVDWGAALTAAGDVFTSMRDNLLLQMATAITATDWTSVVTGMINSLTTTIATTDWTAVGKMTVASLAVAMGLSLLAVTWVFDSKNWANLVTSVTTAFSTIDWSKIGASLIGLKDAIAKALGDFASGLTAGFKTPEWLNDLINWKWPSLSELTGWKWPSLAELTGWGWPKLPEWKWPEIGMPDWVNNLLNWRPFGNAEGTSYSPGGVTLVGERGAELTYLSPGEKVMTAGQTNRRSGESGAPTINISLAGVQIRNDRDLHSLAYDLGNLIAAGM